MNKIEKGNKNSTKSIINGKQEMYHPQIGPI